MFDVSIVRCDSYDRAEVRRALYYLPINISFIEDSATDFLQKLEEDVRGN